MEIPDAFVTSTVAREGLAGEAWTAALPGRVREPCRRWDLVVEGPTLLSYVAVDPERPGLADGRAVGKRCGPGSVGSRDEPPAGADGEAARPRRGR